MTDATLPEQIAERLRHKILEGTLAPGEQIKERDHAAEMDVSRTPMRESIRILAKEGLVTLRPSRSPIVADPTIEEISDVIDVLTALELLSGSLACKRATDAEIKAIRGLYDEMERKQNKVDKIAFFEIDMKFHMAIVDAAHSAVLAETHSSFIRRLWRARYLSASLKDSRERLSRQHGNIMIALEQRDPAMMKIAISEHLHSLVENIRDKYSSEADGSDRG